MYKMFRKMLAVKCILNVTAFKYYDFSIVCFIEYVVWSIKIKLKVSVYFSRKYQIYLDILSRHKNTLSLCIYVFDINNYYYQRVVIQCDRQYFSHFQKRLKNRGNQHELKPWLTFKLSDNYNA